MPVVTLTSAFVKTLTPPIEGRVEYWDQKTPGLCLRVAASGKASWSFRYRPREGAGFQRITLGRLADLPLSEARERAMRYRVQVSDGGDPQRARVKKRGLSHNVLTFGKLAERYLDEYAKTNKASWKNDETYLKRPRAKWAEKPVVEIRRRDVIDLLDEIKATAPVSANRTQSVLSGMFNWAVDGELLPANPVAGLKKRAKETSKDRVLSDSEISVLWHALKDTTDMSKDVADALRLLLLTGQRPGEVSGMVQAELVCLDLADAARWEIPASRMKARRPHVLPLAPKARSLLEAVLKRREADGDGESVFASKFASRLTLARHSLSQGLARLIAALVADGPDQRTIRSLKERPPTPHDFRRTVGTGLAALGVLREDRRAVLAHVEGDVHGVHYDKYERLREKKAALEVWEKHVAALIAEKLQAAA
ncbi:tyrosine-type recombinase/integrase [Microvirga thermotolerans]|uniref:DUF4102 domain-containing protein n=1 Tax=Microvirga thermotolerans TaxID=2651334 RepID=A0A5P9JUQ5_9HYPH|nr:site-specific integrase [Microvirga thermotolerans]QFU16562.1 DUF4102 domain-containing protein [Microvirga thermotolerans]